MQSTSRHSSPAAQQRGSAAGRQRVLRSIVLSLLCLCALPAAGIVIRHDRSDASYVADARQYPQLFHLQERNRRKVCIATLIAPRWAITAGHCVDDTPIRSRLAEGERYPLQVAGQSYAVDALVLHPEYSNGKLLQGVDLALLHLDRAVSDVEPVALQRSGNEVASVATLLGWGSTGNGMSGRRHNDGKFRRAENRVDTADLWLEFHFDDPSLPDSPALALEGVAGLGDSGGPALLEGEQGFTLLGIAVGELERSGDDKRQGRYGAIGVYERISRHVTWIDAVLAATPETAP